MEDSEFQAFLDDCFSSLEVKQDDLIKIYGFSTFDKFEFDLEQEEIYFFRDGKIDVVANIIPIGSFNPQSGFWMWGWANEAFPETLRQKSNALKTLEQKTGFEMFGNEMCEIDEDMAWEIAAMALDTLSQEGVYRGPSGNTQYFYSLSNVRRANS